MPILQHPSFVWFYYSETLNFYNDKFAKIQIEAYNKKNNKIAEFITFK